MRFLSASVILDGLSVQCITFCFNAYLITKPILFSITFGKRISGLEEDFAFIDDYFAKRYDYIKAAIEEVKAEETILE